MTYLQRLLQAARDIEKAAMEVDQITKSAERNELVIISSRLRQVHAKLVKGG